MILPALLLMQAAYAPETEAVMNRSRKEAQQRRAQAAEKAQPRSALPLAPEVAARLQACLDAAIADPASGVQFARDWAADGGGFHAGQCEGFSHARAERWDAAMSAFDAAAVQADGKNAPLDAARLWAQAGNAALAGGKADKARGYFDAALTKPLPEGLAKGEIFLDRARANVVLGDRDGARADLDAALRQAPADPLVWLLSATLARRSGDLVRAAHDIAEAVKRAGDDASVALEQGNIAALSGGDAAARAAFNRVLALAPSGEQAAAARAALAQLDKP